MFYSSAISLFHPDTLQYQLFIDDRKPVLQLIPEGLRGEGVLTQNWLEKADKKKEPEGSFFEVKPT